MPVAHPHWRTGVGAFVGLTESGGLGGLSGCQHPEFIAVGISHGYPADFVLANFDASRAERHETVDLRLADHRAAGGARSKRSRSLPVLGINGGPLQVIFEPPLGDWIAVSWSWSADQWPPQRFAPEVPDLLRTVAVHALR